MRKKRLTFDKQKINIDVDITFIQKQKFGAPTPCMDPLASCWETSRSPPPFPSGARRDWVKGVRFPGKRSTGEIAAAPALFPSAADSALKSLRFGELAREQASAQQAGELASQRASKRARQQARSTANERASKP